MNATTPRLERFGLHTSPVQNDVNTITGDRSIRDRSRLA